MPFEELNHFTPNEIWAQKLDQNLSQEDSENFWKYRLNHDFPETVLAQEDKNFKDFYHTVYHFEYSFNIREYNKLRTLFAKVKQEIAIDWSANHELSEASLNLSDSRGYTLWDWYSFKIKDKPELLAKMYQEKTFPRTASELVWAIICYQPESEISNLIRSASKSEKTKAWLKALYTNQVNAISLLQEHAKEFDNEILITEFYKAVQNGQKVIIEALLPLVKIPAQDQQLATAILKAQWQNFSSLVEILTKDKSFPFPLSPRAESNFFNTLLFRDFSFSSPQFLILTAFLLENNLLSNSGWDTFIKNCLERTAHENAYKIIAQIMAMRKELLDPHKLISSLYTKSRLNKFDIDIIKILLTAVPSENKQSLINSFFERGSDFYELIKHFKPSPEKIFELIDKDSWYRTWGFSTYLANLEAGDYLDQTLLAALKDEPIHIVPIVYLLEKKLPFSEATLNTLWTTLLTKDPRQLKVESGYFPLNRFSCAIKVTSYQFSPSQITQIFSQIEKLTNHEFDDFLWHAKTFTKELSDSLAAKALGAGQTERAIKLNPNLKPVSSNKTSTPFFKTPDVISKAPILPKQDELALLKTAVIDAQKNYKNWYKKEEGYSELRGGRGFFTWLRHGPDGQENAVNFKNSIINDAPNLQTAKTLIQNLLTDNKTRYHRHSFASFLIDELAKISYLQVKADKKNLYNEEEVKGAIRFKL